MSEAYFCQMDLYATLGEMTGGKVAKGLDSQSYPEVLLGKQLKGGRPSQVLEAQGRLAYREGDYVLIPAYSGANYNSTGNELGCNGFDTLWDLKADPAQTTPVNDNARLSAMKADFLKIVGNLYSEDTAVDPLE